PERERVYTRTLVRLAISRADVGEIRLSLPGASEVVSVSGPEDPSFVLEKSTGLLTITPARRLFGDVVLSVLSYRPAPKEGAPLESAPSRLAEATSNRAYLLVSPTPLREQTLVSAEGLTRTDVADLPVFARPFSESGTRAYRVTGTGATKLVLNAPLRQAAPLPDPLITQATLLTVFGDG